MPNYEERKRQSEVVNGPLYSTITNPISEMTQKKWAEAHQPMIEAARSGQDPMKAKTFRASVWEMLNDVADLGSIEDDPDAVRKEALNEGLRKAKAYRYYEAGRRQDGLEAAPFDQYMKGSAWDVLSKEGHGK